MAARVDAETARRLIDRSQSEDSLLGQVLELAALEGWSAYHVRRSDRALTIGSGFPDLVLAGHGAILYRELKTETGRLSPAQKRWRDRLLAGGADWAVWRPSDWGLIVEQLHRT